MRARVIGAVIGGVGAILAVALLLGNRWSIEAIARHEGYSNEKTGPLLQYLTFPAWRVSPLRAESLLPVDVGTLVLLALTAALIVPAVRSLGAGAPPAGPATSGAVPYGPAAGAGPWGPVTPAPRAALVAPRGGTFGAIIAGWWATVVAGALAGLVRGLLFNAVESIPGETAWRFVWSTVGSGAGFGLFVGWLTGLGVLIGLGLGRPRPAPPVPYVPPQPGWGVPPPPSHPGFGETPATPPPTARPLPPRPGAPEPYAPGRPADRPTTDPPEIPEPDRPGDRTRDPEPWRREPGSEPSEPS
jgi:hypothetical protein